VEEEIRRTVIAKFGGAVQFEKSFMTNLLHGA
jgi:hypothetical protein